MARATQRQISRGSAARLVASTQQQPPVTYTPPSLTGNLGVGQVLQINGGLYSGDPVPVRRVLLRNGVEIPGTLGASTYTQVSADIGAVLSVAERVSNQKGFIVARGPASPPVPATGSTPVPPVTVVQPPSTALRISGAAGSANVGDTDSFTPTITGGRGPYTVAVTGLPPGRSLANAATGLTTGAYTTAGNYSATYTVTDSTGATATFTRAVLVSPAAGSSIVTGMTLSSSAIAEDVNSNTLIGSFADITATGADRPGLALSNLTIPEDAADGTIVGNFQ